MRNHYYKIEQLRTTEKIDKSDVIYTVLARLYFESEGEEVGTKSLLTKLDTSDLSSFVPLDELTEDKVINWVKQIHEPSVDQYYNEVLEMNEQIKEIDKNKTVRQEDLPWTEG
jgi:hypothetical protein